MTVSETITENIFRSFYGSETFVEKSAISKTYGFTSKKGTEYKGYPDFFLELEDFCLVVEAKAIDQLKAVEEVKFYMLNNKITKSILGIAVSGQNKKELRVDYFVKQSDSRNIVSMELKDNLFDFETLNKYFYKTIYGESITNGELIKTLSDLNKQFNKSNRVPDTERSLFFSGIMIALKDNTFRNTYKNIEAPSKIEVATTAATILEAHNLNKAMLEAINSQLQYKINNMSKEYSWSDKFAFIKNIDYPLNEYKEIINKIETKIFKPFKNGEKYDILGRAYKEFLSRAGNVDNKNIILTPDHIKSLMVKLARLTKDDVVLDTCTGSGGFLMEAMETLTKLCENNPEKIQYIKEKQLIGFEVNATLFALACSNMFLHGDGRTNLLYRSSLLYNNSDGIINNKDEELFKYIKSLKPTKVIINPPYEDNNSIRFTKQALEYLEPNGKLVIIMPTPTLTQNQGGLTEEILKIAKLDFVIKMPSNLFSEQKRIVNTSIFGFTKTPHDKDDDVLFYNLKDDGFVSIQHKGRVDKNKNGWAEVESEIINAIRNSKEKENICEKKKIYLNDELNCYGVSTKRKSKYELIKISKLFEIKKGNLASDDAEEGEYDFITASEEWGKHINYSEECEALVFAFGASGSLGRTHYVNGKFTASNLCYILKEREDNNHPINLKFYNYYFKAIRERLVDDLAGGTSKLTISDKALKDYYIEYIPIEIQNKYEKEVINRLEMVEKELKNYREMAKEYISKIVK